MGYGSPELCSTVCYATALKAESFFWDLVSATYSSSASALHHLACHYLVQLGAWAYKDGEIPLLQSWGNWDFWLVVLCICCARRVEQNSTLPLLVVYHISLVLCMSHTNDLHIKHPGVYLSPYAKWTCIIVAWSYPYVCLLSNVISNSTPLYSSKHPFWQLIIYSLLLLAKSVECPCWEHQNARLLLLARYDL